MVIINLLVFIYQKVNIYFFFILCCLYISCYLGFAPYNHTQIYWYSKLLVTHIFMLLYPIHSLLPNFSYIRVIGHNIRQKSTHILLRGLEKREFQLQRNYIKKITHATI